MTAPHPLAATVLICTRERPRMLEETVGSVLAGERLPSELLIVDQSASPHPRLGGLGTVDGCAVRYLHAPDRGLSRARNVGLRAASCDVVVLIDDDVFVEPRWLERLLDGLDAGGELAVATGRVLAAPHEGTAGIVPYAALVTRTTPDVFRGRQPIDVVPGANVAMHRATALRLGGYDERLGAGTRFASGEDNDFGLRLLDAGGVVRHVPDAVVLHRAWRTGRQRARMRWDYGRGKGAFYMKHLRRSDPYARRRLTADVGRRLRLVGGAIPHRPRTAAAHGLYLAGLVAGAVEWRARERRRRRRAASRIGR